MENQRTDPTRPQLEDKKDEGKLERLARKIDPSGKEVSNDDLKDPGRMTPGAPLVDNRT